MPAIPLPLRIDRIQQSLTSVLSEAVAPAEVYWTYTEPTQESLPDSYVTLSILAGPGPLDIQGKRGSTLRPIDTLDITVDSVTVGKRYGVVLNEFNYFTDGVGGDTVSDVRDRLVTAIEADALETASAVAGAAGVLALTADSLGGIRSLRIYGALSTSNIVTNANDVLLYEGDQAMTINVQSYSKERSPRLGAWALSQQCLAAFQTTSMANTLRTFGVSVGFKSSPVDLTEIAGAYWQSRTSFDVTVYSRATWVEPVDVIETVTTTITGNGPEGTPIATTTFTATAP